MMKNFTEHWLRKPIDGPLKISVTDSCNSHFGKDVKNLTQTEKCSFKNHT